MTLSEMYTEIFYRLNVATGNPFWSDAQILDAINEGYRHFTETTLCYKKFKPLQVTASTSTYDLPSDLIKLIWVGYDGRTVRNLGGMHLNDIDNKWLSNTGTPGYYTHSLGGLDKISLYLQPTTSGTTLITAIDWTEEEDFYDKNPERTDVFCLCAFDDYLYAGIGTGGLIFKSQGDSTWTSAQDLSDTKVYSMAVFGGALYVGTGSVGKIYKSTDGSTFTEVKDVAEDDVWVLHVFESKIYAGCDEKIYQSSDGATWTEVEDRTTGDIKCFATYNDKIYAGWTGSGKIYSSTDGTTWAEAGDLGADADNPLSMAVFNNTLYVGSGDSGKIFSTTTGTSYTEVKDTGGTSIHALATFDDHIYCASDNDIFSSPDGATWTDDGGDIAAVTNPPTNIHCLTTFKNKLYAGTDTRGYIFSKQKLETMPLYTYYGTSSYKLNLLLYYAYADVGFDDNEWTSREVDLESVYHWALVYYALYMLFKENNEAQNLVQSNYYKLLYMDLTSRKIAQQKSLELINRVSPGATGGMIGDGPFLPEETSSTYTGEAY